jgi:PDZ domain-containing protein
METRMKALLLFSAAASASLVSCLSAQVVTPKADSAKADSACTSDSQGRVECRVYKRGPGDSTLRHLMYYKMDSAMAKRSVLGLELRSTGTRRDTLGIFVEAVTPKGPAEAAGIVEGDRIAAINGVDLRTSVADTEDSYTGGLASHRLTREVQKLAPGTRVTLRVFSGGRYRDVQVTTGKASELMRFGGGYGYRMPMDATMGFDGPGMMMFGPDMQMLRERMPMMKQRLEPLLRENFKQMDPQLRERLRELPEKIQLRIAPRMKTMGPVRVRVPRTYKVDRGADWNVAQAPEAFSWDAEMGDVFMLDDMELDQPFDFQLDDAPFVFDIDEEPFEFEDDITTVSPEEIRELAATTARDARAAIERLAADGVV